MFVLDSGDVLACGSNEYGQLGLPYGAQTQSTPTKLQCFADMPIKRAAAGGHHTVFNGFDGSVWSVGCNEHGQLGAGEIATIVSTPVRVDFAERVKFIAAGPQCSAAITEIGGLYTWGDPVEGQVGNSGEGQDPLFHHFQPVARNWNQPKPFKVQMPAGQAVRLVSIGGTVQLTKGAGHVTVITNDGETLSFGLNRNGQLGRDTMEVNYGSISPRSPKQVDRVHSVVSDEAREAWMQQCNPTPTGFQDSTTVQVSSGGEHTFAVTSTGQLFAWGEGNHGQLAAAGVHSERAQGDESKAVAVELEQPARQVECGVHHTLAVGVDGEVYVWGDFSSSADHSDPTKIGVIACDCSWSLSLPEPEPVPVPEPVPELMEPLPPPSPKSVNPQDDEGYLAYIIRELRAKLESRDAEWVVTKLTQPESSNISPRSASPSGSPRSGPTITYANKSSRVLHGEETAHHPVAANEGFEALLAKLEEAEGQVELVTSHLKTAVNADK